MSGLKGAAIAAALLLTGTAPAALAQTQTLKLAYVNSAIILQNTPGGAQAESTYQRGLDSLQQQAGAVQNQLDSASSEFARTSLVLSPAARQRRQQELAQMRDRAQQQVQDLQAQATQLRQQLMGPIVQRIQAVIDGIRAEYNYAMIFDLAAQSGGVVVSADPSLDITALVINRLQQGAAAAAAAPAAPADTTRPPAARPPKP